MRRVYGTDEVAFSTCSLTLDAGQTSDDALATLRHFGQISQAARENALSRIYVGFHLRRAACGVRR